MTFRFWGVRGSLPCPLSPQAVKAKVSAIVQRLRPTDLEGPEARERFLADLPQELFGTVGGNTTCLEVEADQGHVLIVDAGTGIRELGRDHRGDKGLHYHILLTHFHWDHLHGIPFFSPLAQARNRVTFYSPVRGFEKLVRHQMQDPFFPVPLSAFPAEVSFVELDSLPRTIGGTEVSWKRVNHPGVCVCYRFARHGRRLIFSTDTELRSQDFDREPSNLDFFSGVDTLILDAQYTLDEAVERSRWGHTSTGLAVDFALDFGAKTLFLFHHEPEHDDSQIAQMGRAAQWYADHRSPGALKVAVAVEGVREVVH